ncbi:MAG: hypothetical protein PHT19_07340 [Methylococcus sp.]|nr:hypothetical protein [Methylococcus sp.]
MNHSTHADLRQEAEHFYCCLFGSEAPPALIMHYLAVHQCLTELSEVSVEHSRTLRIIIGRRLNAAAIEPWLRRKGRRHALTAKLLLVVYLAECGSGHIGFSRHVRVERGALIFAALRGLAGLCHGYYLRRYHGLV